MKHNEGGCPHTSKYRPWIIQNYIDYYSIEKTFAFEKYLKSGPGNESSKNIFNEAEQDKRRLQRLM